jgi:sugar O-acyltransferase (sialic acid O-acetyltransferase NeuD family)
MNDVGIVIVGAGGFGREVAYAAERANVPSVVRGFVDDAAKESSPEGWPVLGKVREVPPRSAVVIAIGNPRVRRAVCGVLGDSGVRYARVDVDGRRHVTVSIGEGSVLVEGVRTTVHTTIGRHVIANLNCTIGHDVVIKDFVTIAPLVAISGNARIGSGVEIGTGSCIREGVTVGDGAMVGMGAVVVKDVEPNAVVVGNPARQIKTLPVW